MADDRNRRKIESARAEQPCADPRRNLLTVVVVGGLMLLEGAGIFAAAKFLGAQPQLAEAAPVQEKVDSSGNLLLPQTELQVTDVVAFNSKTGRVFIYHLTIFVEVDTEHAGRLEQILKQRQNTVEDRFSQVIRACDPKYMDEPGLETIRRQFKTALEEVTGQAGVINQILIPQFNKTRAD